MPTERLRIDGLVQGVGFRWWAIRTAGRLNVHGWVRNRRDGSVEILAHGDQAALAALKVACEEGPRAARITALRSTERAEGDPHRLKGIGFAALATD